MDIHVTRHAKEQACARWMLPDEAHAHHAICDVLKHGTVSSNAALTTYRWGSRVVRVVNGAAVTVLIHRQKQTARAQRKARWDMKRRRRGRSP